MAGEDSHSWFNGFGRSHFSSYPANFSKFINSAFSAANGFAFSLSVFIYKSFSMYGILT
jgi:hypothetical protein